MRRMFCTSSLSEQVTTTEGRNELSYLSIHLFAAKRTLQMASIWQIRVISCRCGYAGDLEKEVFFSLAGAEIAVEIWRQNHNQERPHSSLGYDTPAELAAGWKLESKRDLE